VVLSNNYIGRLLFGWGIYGYVFFKISDRYIEGPAIFFALVGVASWSLFPFLHFIIAAILAQNLKEDPPAIVSCMFAFFAIAILLLVLAIMFYHHA
jgi:hypothetical protein